MKLKILKLTPTYYAGTYFYDGFYFEDPDNLCFGIWFHYYFIGSNKLVTTLGYLSNYEDFKSYLNKYSKVK